MFILRDVVTGCEQQFDSLSELLPYQAYLEVQLNHATELFEVRKAA